MNATLSDKAIHLECFDDGDIHVELVLSTEDEMSASSLTDLLAGTPFSPKSEMTVSAVHRHTSFPGILEQEHTIRMHGNACQVAAALLAFGVGDALDEAEFARVADLATRAKLPLTVTIESNPYGREEPLGSGEYSVTRRWSAQHGCALYFYDPIETPPAR